VKKFGVMTNAELLVELVTGAIEERATGVFLKVLDSGREVYTCKCPVCGTLHGGYRTLADARAHLKCKQHFRSEIEKTKKDIEKVDEPEKERNIFQKPLKKPAVLGEMENDEIGLGKALGEVPDDYIAYNIYDGREWYPLSLHGFIGRYDWGIRQLSGDWKIRGMTFHHWSRRPIDWQTMRSRLDAGEALNGYLWDVDHGTTRRWGRKVKVYKVRVSESEESIKSMLGEYPVAFRPGEVNKWWCENATRGDRLYHRTKTMADGSPLSVRVMGRCITWKSRPDEYRLPVKFGLSKSFYITDVNAGDWTTIDPSGEHELPAPDPGGGGVAEGWAGEQPALDALVE
jgi:hypothetical protein